MATFKDLEFDWSMLCQECPECWTQTDLQLAAELGKTLLERNKELENAIKHHQTIIEDQTQEIEYLTKQTVALREVNDSRLRIYEQLEVSIQDLERANHRLALENSADKKHVKSLTTNIEALEAKCDDLQGTIDDLRLQVDVLKRRAQRPPESPPTPVAATVRLRHVDYGIDEGDSPVSAVATPKRPSEDAVTTPKSLETPLNRTPEPKLPTKEPEISQNVSKSEETDVEQMTQVLSQLREVRLQGTRDQRRVTELEEQLATMVQQNQALETQIMQMHNKDEDMKSMHEEFTTLEEVRQGQMCRRCLRSMFNGGDSNASMSVCSDPEDDDASMLEALCDSNSPQFYRSSFTMDVQEYNAKTSSPNTSGSNLYRDLVQKYEALLEIHRQPTRIAHKPSNCLSLQEEMQLSGDFDTLSTKDTDEESGHGDSLKDHRKVRKVFSHTPTDFSEAETSSSGFADETSNKCTQTEGRPGSFLCTIADGEDCRFSIYDDASPIDSRFRNRPEYRELFREIFTVLKKAAENKDEGEELPLLDDHTPVKSVPKVPPVTPAGGDLPDFPDLNDDTQSVVSSSETSVDPGEQTLQDVQIESDLVDEDDEFENPTETKQPECVLKPLVRPPLEYLSVSVNVRKRSSSRRKNKNVDRSDSPITHIIGSPKITYASRPNSGRKQRELRNKTDENLWNGSTLQFWSRKNSASPTPSQGGAKTYFEYKPSSASQDLHKLKRLDLSYAEVLRNASTNKKQSKRK